ncbi:hypothetical protein UB34_16390 [Photobacterium leiognathi]|uniref:Uncharacterized protein n=1 Tax=Photobacterium leiognathi TaxID=553611 RepID=A0A2T3M4Q1_PHOLE|nr:hypothetical protein UB42_19240 [Photobacterium leiognathi]KJF96816.1 hypothetical protein UB34_16390 [Photobacterium leiognathi]PSV81925.1 hypothetical protein CTM94_10785 [Photobacterium leiognathi]PSV86875.1 hypothetical protein CTM89_20095 [Photobacterium leiognathi]
MKLAFHITKTAIRHESPPIVKSIKFILKQSDKNKVRSKLLHLDDIKGKNKEKDRQGLTHISYKK